MAGLIAGESVGLINPLRQASARTFFEHLTGEYCSSRTYTFLRLTPFPCFDLWCKL